MDMPKEMSARLLPGIHDRRLTSRNEIGSNPKSIEEFGSILIDSDHMPD
jgi:hypothetical protein